MSWRYCLLALVIGYRVIGKNDTDWRCTKCYKVLVHFWIFEAKRWTGIHLYLVDDLLSCFKKKLQTIWIFNLLNLFKSVDCAHLPHCELQYTFTYLCIRSDAILSIMTLYYILLCVLWNWPLFSCFLSESFYCTSMTLA